MTDEFKRVIINVPPLATLHGSCRWKCC